MDVNAYQRITATTDTAVHLQMYRVHTTKPSDVTGTTNVNATVPRTHSVITVRQETWASVSTRNVSARPTTIVPVITNSTV